MKGAEDTFNKLADQMAKWGDPCKPSPIKIGGLASLLGKQLRMAMNQPHYGNKWTKWSSDLEAQYRANRIDAKDMFDSFIKLAPSSNKTNHDMTTVKNIVSIIRFKPKFN